MRHRASGGTGSAGRHPDCRSSVFFRTEKQRAQEDGENKTNNSGNQEMAEREVLPAFAAPALPFSGGHELFDGFEAGAGVHWRGIDGKQIPRAARESKESSGSFRMRRVAAGQRNCAPSDPGRKTPRLLDPHQQATGVRNPIVGLAPTAIVFLWQSFAENPLAHRLVRPEILVRSRAKNQKTPRSSYKKRPWFLQAPKEFP